MSDEIRDWRSDTHCACGCGLPVQGFTPGTVVWRGRCWAESCYYLARGTTGVVDDILKTLNDKPVTP